MRRWPDVLPTPSMPGFGLSPVDPALRTDMEVGAQRVRRITFARNDLVDMAWVMTDTEFAAFRAWWNDEAWSLAGDSESLAAWGWLNASRAIGAGLSPDGAIVDALVESTANGLHHAQIGVAADANATVLCRATLKASGRTWARLSFFDRAGAQCYTEVDLANGVFGAQSGLVSRTLESRDNGQWRVTLTAPVVSGGSAPVMRISAMAAAATPSYLGDGVSGLLVSEIGARMVTGYDLHLRTGSDGKVTGAAGTTAWALMPTAVGGGFKYVEGRFKGMFKATAGPALNWDVTAQMEVRNA
ncbi:MAG: hypothetical protein CFE33_15025 [Pseudorhodobacter sp. PARRP1]|nr:MAG: hypothetical protein CFE33_15025 [Pseudorhodobacter sp. PARRP1]